MECHSRTARNEPISRSRRASELINNLFMHKHMACDPGIENNNTVFD